jgi:hypothetical protein
MVRWTVYGVDSLAVGDAIPARPSLRKEFTQRFAPNLLLLS